MTYGVCSQFLPIPDPRTSILFSAPVDHEATEGGIVRRPRGFLFFSIYRYPISASRNVYSGLVSSHCQRNQEADRERERERKREREKIKNRKQRVGKRGKKKRTFFIPLLDELARYRVARRSNHSERGGERERERDKRREREESVVGWGVWTALPRWTQRIAITN